jgi:hypothetical protein
MLAYRAYSSTVNIEAQCSSQTSEDFYQITLHHITEDDTVHSHRIENLTPYDSDYVQPFTKLII